MSSANAASVYYFNEPGCASHRPANKSTYKQERKTFMSPRASDVFKEIASQTSKHVHDEVVQEEFKNILEEVEDLGASQLSWKARKELEAKGLLALGAKAPKGQKMPIEMGRNIKRKRELFEQKKRIEAGDTGLPAVSSSSKKKSVSRNSENRGLRASEGIFKRGVLHVKPLPRQSANFYSKRNGIGSIFSVGMNSRRAIGKKTKKHKQK